MTSTIIPLIYGLLIGKIANDYSVFFRKVLEQDNFSPETILTDFETGTIKSIKETLPHVIHKGRKKRNIIKDTNYPSFSLRLSISLWTKRVVACSKQGTIKQISRR